MLQSAADMGMFVANTFDHIVMKGGDRGTFCGGSGLGVSCDYILLGDAVAPKLQSMETWASFRMGNKEPDHLPTKLVCTVTSFSATPVSRRRRPRYDRSAVHNATTDDDPEVVAKRLLFE